MRKHDSILWRLAKGMFRPRNFLLGGIAKNPALPGFEVASSINFQISLMAVVAVEAKGREVAPPFLLLRY